MVHSVTYDIFFYMAWFSQPRSVIGKHILNHKLSSLRPLCVQILLADPPGMDSRY